jgi:hypothetical protein
MQANMEPSTHPFYHTDKLEILQNYINEKQTVIGISLVYNNWTETEKIIKVLGPYVCMISINPYIIQDWQPEHAILLNEYACTYKFQIICDLKLLLPPEILEGLVLNSYYNFVKFADWISINPYIYNDINDYYFINSFIGGIKYIPIHCYNRLTKMYEVHENLNTNIIMGTDILNYALRSRKLAVLDLKSELLSHEKNKCIGIATSVIIPDTHCSHKCDHYTTCNCQVKSIGIALNVNKNTVAILDSEWLHNKLVQLNTHTNIIEWIKIINANAHAINAHATNT